jgi:hypothetical protein
MTTKCLRFVENIQSRADEAISFQLVTVRGLTEMELDYIFYYKLKGRVSRRIKYKKPQRPNPHTATVCMLSESDTSPQQSYLQNTSQEGKLRER